MALVRQCDICGNIIKEYVKLNAKEYGGGEKTKNKKPLINIDICDSCFKDIKKSITTHIDMIGGSKQ